MVMMTNKNLITIALAVIVIVIIAVVAAIFIDSDNRPIDNFVTSRKCDFVDIVDFHAFVCEDGLLGTYIPLK